MKEFSYEEVVEATGGFAAKNLVGKGSHGSVYRAKLRGGGGRMVVVAVKKPAHEVGAAKLVNEIAVLSAAPRHPSIVGVVGVAVQPPVRADTSGEGEEVGPKRVVAVVAPLPRLLVMEFVPNGSLHDLLHRSPRPPTWSRRVEIALDVARAVRALHAARPQAIIHRDVKSANILLGRDGRARLADFGLAVVFSSRVSGGGGGCARDDEDVDPAPAGTIGYLDPCYTEPGRLGPESDVFSFGVVLLELVSGRKVMDVNSCPSSIVSWATPLIGAGRAREVFDARVTVDPPPATARAVARVLAVAARCVSESVDRRPAMAEVVSELRGALEDAGWRHRRGSRGYAYAHGVVESVCRRVVAWGRHVRRVRATKIECTEHSGSGAGAPKPEDPRAPPPLDRHPNSTNDDVPK